MRNCWFGLYPIGVAFTNPEATNACMYLNQTMYPSLSTAIDVLMYVLTVEYSSTYILTTKVHVLSQWSLPYLIGALHAKADVPIRTSEPDTLEIMTAVIMIQIRDAFHDVQYLQPFPVQ